jgi:hypothetical protein
MEKLPLEQIHRTESNDQSVFGLSLCRSLGRLSSALCRPGYERPTQPPPPPSKIHGSGCSGFKVEQLQELTEAHGFPLQFRQCVAQTLGRVIMGEKQQALGLPDGTHHGIPQHVPGTGGMLPVCCVCCLLGHVLLPEPVEPQHLVTF